MDKRMSRSAVNGFDDNLPSASSASKGEEYDYNNELIDSERGKRLLEEACKSWQAGLYSDVELVVGDQRFKTHRLVLASLSDYFRPLFKQDEKNSGEVTIHDIDPSDFSVLLKYAYTGKVDITADNAQSLLIASDYLGVSHVKKICVDFMADSLDCDNIGNALKFSEAYSLSELKEKATKFLVHNLKPIAMADGYFQIDPSILSAIFESDKLILYDNGLILKSVQREALVLKSVLAYLEGQKENDPQTFEMMIRAVRLTEIPKDVIIQCLNEFKSMKENHIVRKYVSLVDVANQYLYDRGQDYSMTQDISRDAEEIPDSWFRRRKLVDFTISLGVRRYAAGGQISPTPNPPSFQYNNFEMEIKSIELWMRRWDGWKLIGGLQLTYRIPHQKEDFTYKRGECRSEEEYHKVELEPSEFIVKVTIGSGWLINRLGFETNRGRVFGLFGGPGGDEYTEVAYKTSDSSLAYLYDINCDEINTQGSKAIYNLMFRWITME